MASFTRIKSGLGETLKLALGIDTLQVKVGWFEGAKYPDGTSVAYIATIHEFGTTFTHPGGTKYIVINGKARFVNNSYDGPHGITGPHQITIPPRPFMRPTIASREKKWAKIVESGAKDMLLGNATPLEVLGKLALGVQGDIYKTIVSLTKPELKRGTIKARLKKLADGKTIGQLTKPLEETGYLLTSLQSVVE